MGIGKRVGMAWRWAAIITGLTLVIIAAFLAGERVGGEQVGAGTVHVSATPTLVPGEGPMHALDLSPQLDPSGSLTGR